MIAAAAIPGPVVLLACAAILACFALVATARHETAHRGVGCSPSARPSVRVTPRQREVVLHGFRRMKADPRRVVLSPGQRDHIMRRPYNWAEEEAVPGHCTCAICVESQRRLDARESS